MTSRSDGVPLRDAAERLDTSVDALRKRIKRGSLTAYKDDAGHWYVVLPAVQDTASTPSSQSSPGQAASQVDALLDTVARQDAEIAFLRAELEARRESERELRIVIGRLEQRLALPPGSTDATQGNEQAPSRQPDTAVTHDAPGPNLSVWKRFKARFGM